MVSSFFTHALAVLGLVAVFFVPAVIGILLLSLWDIERTSGSPSSLLKSPRDPRKYEGRDFTDAQYATLIRVLREDEP